MKSIAIAHLNHRSSDVRGVARAIVDGDHQMYGILFDTLLDSGDSPMTFEIGKTYYIETLRNYYVGVCVAFDLSTVKLDSACWVASTGYITEFMRTGEAEGLEVEILGDGFEISVGMIIARKLWPHKIWKEAVRG